MATLADALRYILLFDPYGTRRIYSAAAMAAMTSDQARIQPLFGYRPESIRQSTHWGIGFILKDRSADSGIASPESFGHEGASALRRLVRSPPACLPCLRLQ